MNRSDALGMFEVVWKLDNYVEIFNKAIDSIYKFEKEKSYMIYHYFMRLLSFLDKNGDFAKRDAFVKDYIKQHSKNKKRIGDLFAAMNHLTLSKKQEFVVYLCQINPSFDILDEVDFHFGSRSWSGSEVPVIEKEINGFKEMQDALSGSEYLEHRDLLSKIIAQREKEKKAAITREFLDDSF